MNQRKYALELLIDTGLVACKPALTPINNHAKSLSTRVVLSQVFKPIKY